MFPFILGLIQLLLDPSGVTGRNQPFEFAEMPLAALFADATVNPKFVAEYTFPGVITGFYTHLEYIKLVP
mgnify:CR=1 FL=1